MTAKMLARYVVEAVAMETGISTEAIKGRARNLEVMGARRLAYFATPELGLTISEMARYLNRSHTTLCKTIQRVRITFDDRRTLEAIKLTAQIVALERDQKFHQACTTGALL